MPEHQEYDWLNPYHAGGQTGNIHDIKFQFAQTLATVFPMYRRLYQAGAEAQATKDYEKNTDWDGTVTYPGRGKVTTSGVALGLILDWVSDNVSEIYQDYRKWQPKGYKKWMR